MKDFLNVNKESIIKITYFFIFAFFIFIFFKFLFNYIAPFFIGWVLSILICIPTDFLNYKFKIPRWISVILSIVLVIFIIVIVINAVISKIFYELYSFAGYLPEEFNQLTDSLLKLQNAYSDFFNIIPDQFKDVFQNSVNGFANMLTTTLGNTIKSFSITIVSTLPSLIFKFVITIISLFFFAKDRDLINSFLLRQLPKNFINTMKLFKEGIIDSFMGYIKTQLIIMCFTSSITVIGLFILKSEYILLMSILISVVDALPVLGSGFILFPWTIFSLILGNYNVAIGLIIIYLVIQLTRQVIEPRIYSNQMGMYPIVTLISMYICMQMFGFFGFIAGPIFMMTIISLQKSKALPNWK